MPLALRVLGEIDARRGNAAAAEAQFSAALELAAELEMRPLLAHCHDGLARALEATGQDAAAKSHRETAAALFRPMEMRIRGQGLDVEPASST